MLAPGAHHGTLIGPEPAIGILINSGGGNDYAMAALNTGWAARFVAPDTSDIKSLRCRWTSVTTPGTVQWRIEAVDATVSPVRPNGSLYDANATFDITPSAGIQTYTFSPAPTTGLTAGTTYAVVLLTTVGGTTQTLGSYINSAIASNYPTIVLTAADGTTRTNFAEVAASLPCISLVNENDVEIPLEFVPYSTAGSTGSNVFGSDTNVAGMTVALAASVTVSGVEAFIGKTGTPAGDLRCRILDSGKSPVSGATVTVDKESLAQGASLRQSSFLFASDVTLPAGTYYIAFDSADSANSSNCWTVRSVAFLHQNAVANNYQLVTSSTGIANLSASTTQQAGIWLKLSNLVAGGGPVSGNIRGGFIN